MHDLGQFCAQAHRRSQLPVMARRRKPHAYWPIVKPELSGGSPTCLTRPPIPLFPSVGIFHVLPIDRMR
jgi:hypothetical protein